MTGLVIPAQMRAKVYAILGVTFLIIGSVDTGVAVVIAAQVSVPLWLTLAIAVATKVALYVAGAVGYVAATHTTPAADAAVASEVLDDYQAADVAEGRRYLDADGDGIPDARDY